MKRTKSKLIAAAVALLGFSAAASVTGTVAWFTAANTVSISGFNLQAEAEQGIVIANETHSADTDWKTEVTASHSGTGERFVVTSSPDCDTWYHAYAIGAGVSTTTAHETLTVTPTNGLGVTTIGTASKNIYLLNKFYIQASNKSVGFEHQDIYLTNLSAAVTGSDSTALDQTLRLGVVVKDGSSVLSTSVFAPLAAAEYTKNTNTTYHPATVITPASASTKTTIVSDTSIAAYTTAGTDALEFNVYAYFDGEDDKCMSANIPSSGLLDSIAVSFVLGNEAHVNP